MTLTHNQLLTTNYCRMQVDCPQLSALRELRIFGTFLLPKPHFWNMVSICKTKFWDTLVSGFFYLVDRKQVIQRKRNFWTTFESLISPTNLQLRYFFLFCSEFLTLWMLWSSFCDLGLFFSSIFFLIHIFYQKSTHISHNILESQNAIHNICRVRYSKRNGKPPLF